ncbi:hypothetical protein ADIWIN_0743 [Winogradskyella psychrotolerans RS-3]|uniref:Uncharacterized protein n=2 Tax=Winogradskyella TaxID=286104 RepID=S7VVQ0_9FLAO|nr:hypothetical protein ADIWIN_0743 [Winogradskyella psychrotolerans RS-3]
MIKFFRKIRQNLIMENQTSKYLKYAIGEIILVVIGILIALQINNWNENQKAKQLEANFFDNVLIELKKDQLKLNYYKNFHTKRIEYLDTLLTYVRNPNKTMGIDKFGMYVEPLFYASDPTNYNITFESAKSLGTFNNFKEKELLKDLSQYYTDFTLIEKSFSSISRFIENQFEPIMYTLPENYINKNTGNLVINEGSVQEFYNKVASIKDYRGITADYEKILKTPKLENYLIGDMGRTFGAISIISTRQHMLNQLLKN